MDPWLETLGRDLPVHLPMAAALTVFVVAIAYVHAPRLKAFIYSLPVPFTCAYLAGARPINATHLSGLMLVVGYNWLVWLLRRRGAPLAPAIVVAALLYVGGAAWLRPLAAAPVPWVAAAALAPWGVTVGFYRGRAEPGHRSSSPWYVKAPLVFLIALVLYRTTPLLAGGVATFPYAGVFTSYESRHSLRTLAGQFTINALGIGLMIVAMWAVQESLPPPATLAVGWSLVLAWAAVVRRLRLGAPPDDAARR